MELWPFSRKHRSSIQTPLKRKFLFVWGTVVIFYGAFLIIRHPILLKRLFGLETRIAGLPSACTIKLNQQKLRSAKCFRIVSEFNWEDKRWNRPTDQILLWLPQPKEYRDNTILVANLEQNEAGRPSNTDYLSIDLIWNQVLVQSKGASGYLSFTDRLKFCGREPKFQQENQAIQFTPPPGCVPEWLSGTRLQITFE